MDSNKEVINILMFGIFDSKVFNKKDEGYIIELVEEKAPVAAGFYATEIFEVLNKIFLGNYSSFFLALPSTFHFSVNKTINNFLFNVLVLDFFRGMMFYWKWTYRASRRSEHKYILEKAMKQYLAPGLERTVFQYVFIFPIEAIYLVVLPK